VHDAFETIGDEHHLPVGKDQTEQIGGDRRTDIQGDREEKVGGTTSLQTQDLILEAGSSITLR